MKGRAWFVFEPRRTEDLAFGCCKGKWMEYEIVKTICLSKIDYENFSTDLLADRQFIEDSIALCRNTGDCLLVTDRKQTEEILVMPWHERFVRYAALRPLIKLL